MSSEPKGTGSGNAKTLIPILVIVGVLLCGCIALPAIGGLALLGFIGLRAHDAQALPEHAVADGMLMPGELNLPTIPEGVPADLGGGFGGGNKQAAQAEMQAAQAELQLAQAGYEAAQAVYEQQRNFANSQGGRLGAQGISVPQPMQPDPSLYQAVLAAQQRYDAAKAAYDAIP